MTAEERRWVSKAVDHGCMICAMPACWHHLRGGSAGIVGAGQRSAHTRGIPICERHHTGSSGIHAIGVETWEKLYGLQTTLHVRLLEAVGEPPEPKRSRKRQSAKIVARRG